MFLTEIQFSSTGNEHTFVRSHVILYLVSVKNHPNGAVDSSALDRLSNLHKEINPQGNRSHHEGCLKIVSFSFSSFRSVVGRFPELTSREDQGRYERLSRSSVSNDVAVVDASADVNATPCRLRQRQLTKISTGTTTPESSTVMSRTQR